MRSISAKSSRWLQRVKSQPRKLRKPFRKRPASHSRGKGRADRGASLGQGNQSEAPSNAGLFQSDPRRLVPLRIDPRKSLSRREPPAKARRLRARAALRIVRAAQPTNDHAVLLMPNRAPRLAGNQRREASPERKSAHTLSRSSSGKSVDNGRGAACRDGIPPLNTLVPKLQLGNASGWKLQLPPPLPLASNFSLPATFVMCPALPSLLWNDFTGVRFGKLELP